MDYIIVVDWIEQIELIYLWKEINIKGENMVDRGPESTERPEDRVPIESSTPDDVLVVMEHVQEIRRKYPRGARGADEMFRKKPEGKSGQEESDKGQ